MIYSCLIKKGGQKTALVLIMKSYGLDRFFFLDKERENPSND